MGVGEGAWEDVLNEQQVPEKTMLYFPQSSSSALVICYKTYWDGIGISIGDWGLPGLGVGGMGNSRCLCGDLAAKAGSRVGSPGSVRM